MTSTVGRRSARRVAAGLGAVLVALALSASSAAAWAPPREMAGNPTCADIQGSQQWSEFTIEPVPSGTSVFPSGSPPSGSFSVKIVVYDTTHGQVFDWAANTTVFAVIVKGGPNANVYTDSAGGTFDNAYHAPVNPNTGTFYGLSHISFCYKPPSGGGSCGETPPSCGESAPPAPAAPPPTTTAPPTTSAPPPAATTPAPAAPPPSAVTVAGRTVRSGRASLARPKKCVNRRFRASVSGREIKSVTFYVNGRRIRTVRARPGAKRVTALLPMSGRTQRIVATVTFRAQSQTKPKTLRMTTVRCGPATIHPQFTG